MFEASLNLMKKIFTAILLTLFSLNILLAQEVQQKPLSQTEYVKMLYMLEKNPASKDEFVETVRTRGIGFELSDGLRSLTRTKSRNDSELQRTVETAERRRANPEKYTPPSAKEAEKVLSEARKATLDSVAEMPDFVVKQIVKRGVAYEGTNNFRNLDRLVVGVSYLASGKEEYTVLSINGILQNNPKTESGYASTGGTSSTGEFVTILEKIFKPESDTEFEAIDSDTLRGRRALVYDFSIERDKAKQGITYYVYVPDSVITGMKGKIWIDRDNFRVLRIESEATEIPSSFKITSAKRTVDYDWVKINDINYMLPSLSEVRLVSRETPRNYETRNRITFKDYQKYGSEVIVVDDDVEIVPDDAPTQNNNDDLPPPPPSNKKPN